MTVEAKTPVQDRKWRDEDPRTRGAVKGAVIGFYVDMFDVYLPVLVLAPAMIYFVPDDLGVGAKSLIAGLIFASTLIGRPAGSLIFGMLADKIGRRKSTLAAVLGCGVTTTATGFLPGFEQIGVASVVLLIAIRFIGGIFMGGEYTGAVPLAMESSPKSRRGFYSGVIGSTFPMAYCTIALISFGLLQLMDSGSAQSAYSTWGWRLPFFIGGALTFWFAWYYATTVSESESWHTAKPTAASANPIRAFFRPGPLRRSLVRVFTVMTGVWFVSNVTAVILPAQINENSGVGATGSTFIWIVGQVILIGAYLTVGPLSQRVGRRNFLTIVGFTTMTLSATAVTLITTGTVTGYGPVILATAVAVCFATCVFGMVPAFVCESFPLDVRGTGYGLGYSLAIIIPSFYAFYQEALTAVMPREYTPTALLILGAVLIIAGARMGPETKHADLSVTSDG